MNMYDSDRMGDLLLNAGYSVSDEPLSSDVLIVNTCHIRELASEKLFSELGRLRNIKINRQNQKKPTTIVVAGCVAQATGEEIFRRASYVDIVLGPQTYHRLIDLIEQNKKQLEKNEKTAVII